MDGYNGHHKKAATERLQLSDGSYTKNDKEKTEEFGRFYTKEVFGRTSPFDATALDEIEDRDIA